MTYSGLAVGLADELYAALRNSTTQYNLCFTASVSVREASHLAISAYRPEIRTRPGKESLCESLAYLTVRGQDN